MPLLFQKSTAYLFPNDTELATFGFLYGTLPTTPSVYVIASQYSIEVQQVTIGIVLCTFLAAPLMFLTATILTLESSSHDGGAILTLTGKQNMNDDGAILTLTGKQNLDSHSLSNEVQSATVCPSC